MAYVPAPVAAAPVAAVAAATPLVYTYAPAPGQSPNEGGMLNLTVSVLCKVEMLNLTVSVLCPPHPAVAQFGTLSLT